MAKSFLSVPINQIPTTSEVSDDDYIIIESPTKGTRIIRKDDLINSGGLKSGKGLKFEDSSTLGVDFENICSTGLSATEDQLMVNYGLGLSADSGGKLFVNTTQLLSGGSPSSIVYYDSSGLSAIHKANVTGTVKHLYWTGSGVLSSVQLTPLGVPTIDAGGNVILFDLTQFSLPQQIVLNATIDGLSSIAGDDDAMSWNGSYVNVVDAVGRWDSQPNYQGFVGSALSGVSSTKKIQSRLLLPAGTYLFDSGFYQAYTATLYAHAQLKLYDGSTGLPSVTIASSAAQYYPWDKSYILNLVNITPGGTFTITSEQATNNWYLQLDFFGFVSYNIYTNGYGANVTPGTLKIIKVG